MRDSSRHGTRACVFLLLLLFVWPLGAKASSGPDSYLVIRKRLAEPGERVSVNGYFWRQDSQGLTCGKGNSRGYKDIELWITPKPPTEVVTSLPEGSTLVGSVDASDEGTFQISVVMPAGLKPGTYSLIGSTPERPGWFSSPIRTIELIRRSSP